MRILPEDLEAELALARRRANRNAWRFAIHTTAISAAVGGALFVVGAPIAVVTIGILLTGRIARSLLMRRWQRRDRR